MSGKRAKQFRVTEKATVESSKRRLPRFVAMMPPFAFGAVVATVVTIMVVPKDTGVSGTVNANSGVKYVEQSPGSTIDPSLIDPETQTVRKWRRVASLDEMLKLTPEELEKVDIAEMNLLCATGLPGAEDLSISNRLLNLDAFASSVRFQTNRHLYRVNDPKYAEHYKHSENVLRAEFLVQVLQEDCGVHYNLERVRNIDFTNSQDLFIHGLTMSNGGTCTSMPVLYVAIARRLGYPVSLARAPGHVLARWDGPEDSNDPMKHFNIEGSGYGFSPNDDEYYHNWPRKMTDDEIKDGFYLRPLTAAEVLGEFLNIRGNCLQDIGRLEEAKKAYELAQTFSPKSPHAASYVRYADYRIKNREYAKAAKSAATQPVAAQPRPRRGDPNDAIRQAEAINTINRENMERMTRSQQLPSQVGPQPILPYSPRPPSPYAPQPGVSNPNQPYQSPIPGQPQR